MQSKLIKMSPLFVFFFSLCLPPSASADVFMKQRHRTEGFQMKGQNQPPRDSVQSIWMTEDRARSDSEKQSIIVRLDTRTAYFLDHSQKVYQEIPMDASRITEQMRDDKRMSREDRAAMGKMPQGMMKMSMTVTETGEKRRIGEWNCRKYLQTLEMFGSPSNSEIWATEDIKVDKELYARFSAALLAANPAAQDNMDAVIREMRKIKGVPVFTTTTANMMNTTVKSTMELLEFKEGRAPAGIFDLPRGYSKMEMPAAEEGGGRPERRPERRRN